MVQSNDISDRITIIFHNVTPSEAVEARAWHLMEKLLAFFPAIMRGSMTIEGRHHHHRQGNLYHVALRLHVPGIDVIVSRDPERNHAHKDIYVAMRDACEAARKQLDQVLKREHGSGVRHTRARFDSNPRNSA